MHLQNKVVHQYDNATELGVCYIKILETCSYVFYLYSTTAKGVSRFYIAMIIIYIYSGWKNWLNVMLKEKVDITAKCTKYSVMCKQC